MRTYDDAGGDPRSWSPWKRAKHLAEIGLPLLHDGGAEVSLYRDVYIHWTTTLDERITLVIDALTDEERRRLSTAYAHKGGCSFFWLGPPPPRLRPSEGVDVKDANGETVDWWVVDESYNLAGDLSTMPYADYLQTDHWRSKRAEAIAHYGDTCVLCGSRPVDVHHRTYERRGEEQLKDLIVLCRGCHDGFHTRKR